MRKISLRLGVAILTFLLGTAVSFVTPRSFHSSGNVPLTVTLTAERWATNPEFYVVKVKNVSRQTIRGYSLGFTCDCRSWDSDDNPYPNGISFMNPQPASQVLLPGESQDFPMRSVNLPQGEFRVWVDLVHFEGKGNWGPNQGHKEGYVRE
jgi:hypothetical protein